MDSIIIGNIIALIASILMVYSGIIKTKKKILYVQTVHMTLFVISNFILGGITGAISNIIGIIRNIFCYKNKLGKKEKIIIILVSTILSLKFNNIGLIGLLPILNMIVYTWFIDIKGIIKFKILLIISSLLWLIHDLYVKSYTSAIFNFANIIANCISIVELTTKKNKRKNVK